MAAAISGSSTQKSASRNSTSVCSAPSAFATTRACSRSSAASVFENPTVNARTGRSFKRAIIASTAVESVPPERNMP
jgi:hypothetical protein